MKKFDVAIVGGGLLGCFAARNLMRYNLTAILIESNEDVAQGITKANTAIVYPGYDNKPGSLKAQMTIRANKTFDNLCEELKVPFNRCGSLMVSSGEIGNAILQRKISNGLESGIDNLRIVSGEEARNIEPSLSENVVSALYCPSTGTVNPWKLCFAALDSAKINGCEVSLNTKLLAINRDKTEYVLNTNNGDFLVKAVINCAGLNSDKIHEMLFEPCVRIFQNGADYIVLDKYSANLNHVIFQEEENGKGITAVPTIEGSILLGPSEREILVENATTQYGLNWIKQTADDVFDNLLGDNVIKSFSAIRPNPYKVRFENDEYVRTNESVDSFAIVRAESRFLSFIGIKTPGITCADELGYYAAKEISKEINAPKKDSFKDNKTTYCINALDIENRKKAVKERKEYGNVVCICEDITEGEIIDAIKNGAVSIDGVKRRCGAALGTCQGSRCRYKIASLLSKELNRPVMDFFEGDIRQ